MVTSKTIYDRIEDDKSDAHIGLTKHPWRSLNLARADNRRYWKHSFPCCCLATTCTLIIFAIIFLPILFTKIIPEFAQKTVSNTVIVLENARMYNGAANTVEMDADLVIYETGILSAKTAAVESTVYDPHGQKMGTLKFPELNVVAGQPLKLSLKETFKCTDPKVFQASIREMTMGNPQNWQLVADTTVDSMGMKFDVSLNKTLPLPALQLLEPKVGNIHGFTGESALVDFSFVTMSPISVTGPAWAVFNVSMDDVVIGTANCSNMVVKQGFNFQPNVVLSMPEVATNRTIYNMILSPKDGLLVKYNDGMDQKMKMIGPISSSAPVMNNILTQDITLTGLTHAGEACPTAMPTPLPTNAPTFASNATNSSAIEGFFSW